MILHDKDAYELFKKRGEKFTDIVVLVDNKSSVETMKPSSPIAMFKHTLEELDNAEDYKRIAVLKGGFEEWQNKYPNCVVRYEKKKSSMHNVRRKYNPANNFFTFLSPIYFTVYYSNFITYKFEFIIKL